MSVKCTGASLDEMSQIVECKYCGGYEYYDEMRWLNGRCECRQCYRYHYEEVVHKPYEGHDLDDYMPTEQDYLIQQGGNGNV